MSDRQVVKLLNSEDKTPYYIYDKTVFRIRKNFLLTWYYLIKLLFFILKVSRFRYFWIYVPHSGSIDTNFIINLPLCKGVSYVEEGLFSYRRGITSLHTDRRLKQILIRLNTFGLSNEKTQVFTEEKASKFYALSKYSFPQFAEKRELIALSHTTNSVYSNCSIIAISRIFELNWISLEDHLGVIDQVIDTIDKENIIFLKYHPRQSNEVITQLRNFAISKYTDRMVEVMDPEVCVEQILLQGNKITIYSDFSSLLLYAVVFGQRSFSYYDKLANKSPKLNEKQFLQFFPEEIREEIFMLN